MSETLRTDRLVLQPLSMSDHAALQAHWSGPLVRRYLFDNEPLTAPQVTEIIAAGQRDFATVGYGLWALRPARRDEVVDAGFIGAALIGTAGLRRLEDEHREGESGAAEDADVEIVYSLEPGLWGRGLAAEAATAVLTYSFEELGLPRVLAEIDEGNAASAALARRLGMRPFETVQGVLGAMTHYVAERASWLGSRCVPEL